MIDLRNITVDFDTVRAVDDFSLRVEKGDVYGIVGFSGAGKSTLVRTINLLQRPSKGEVILEEKDATKEGEPIKKNLMELSPADLRKERKKVGMIFQNFNLLYNRTILGNVIYPIRKISLRDRLRFFVEGFKDPANKKLADKLFYKFRKVQEIKKEKLERARWLLDLVGIADKEKNYPRQLSGGQQQRCAIARALASDPQILLCDEATSALDPKTTKQILSLLKDINERLGLTIVIITHQMDVVKEICNKCAIMQDGKIVEAGTSLEIFANPKSTVAQEFVETATNTRETIEKIRTKLIQLDDDEVLAELKYFGDSATEPMISEIYTRWQVKTNILAGSIELISDVPVGNLIVSFKGNLDKLPQIVDYLKKKNTSLRLLEGANDELL